MDGVTFLENKMTENERIARAAQERLELRDALERARSYVPADMSDVSDVEWEAASRARRERISALHKKAALRVLEQTK
jgi:hypothetical protein